MEFARLKVLFNRVSPLGVYYFPKGVSFLMAYELRSASLLQNDFDFDDQTVNLIQNRLRA